MLAQVEGALAHYGPSLLLIDPHYMAWRGPECWSTLICRTPLFKTASPYRHMLAGWWLAQFQPDEVVLMDAALVPTVAPDPLAVTHRAAEMLVFRFTYARRGYQGSMVAEV